MKNFTRRNFVVGATAVAAAVTVPLGIDFFRKKISALGTATDPSQNTNPNSNALNASDGTATMEESRSSLSLGDRVRPLPLGVWLGLGTKNRGVVSEVTYYAYERHWLYSASQVVGSGGFYRVVGEVSFPASKDKAINATHLLVFDNDRAESADEALAAILLPARLIVPRGSPIQIRDVSIDVHTDDGLRGSWSDDQDLLRERLRRAFRGWSPKDQGELDLNELAVMPNTEVSNLIQSS